MQVRSTRLHRVLPRHWARHALSLATGAVLCCSAFVFAPTTVAQDWEWDPQRGYHLEEWYDPSDWFGDDYGVAYEDYYAEEEDDYAGSYNAFEDDLYEEHYIDEDYGMYDEGYTSWEEDQLSPGTDDYGPYGYDFYSRDWYDDDSDFNTWYEGIE